MSLLKSRKLTGRRKNLLLLIASLLLTVPCIAATPFALSFEINQHEPAVSGQSREPDELQQQARLRAEMFEQVQKLKEEERVANPSARREIEQRLREVQKNLEEHQRLMQQNPQLDPKAMDEAKARLRQVQQNLDEYQRLLQKYQQQEGANAERYREAHKRLAELLTKYEESSELQYARKYVEAQKLLEQQYYAANPQTRRPRVIHRVEPIYPADARDKNIKGSVILTMVVDREGNPQDIKIGKSLYPSMDQAAIEAARQMRFEPALKDGQPVSETLLVEFYFSMESKHVAVYYEVNGVRQMQRRKEQEGQDDRTRKQAELTQHASITMDRAIQVATSKYPGMVLACSLGRDNDGPTFFHVVIVSTEGDKTTTRHVWVSAVDGTIIKTGDEPRRSVFGGVLNGRAITLPQPQYPEVARAAKAEGQVTVEVTIDEQGNVIAARAISGHPLLQGASVKAARQAKFAPTYMQEVRTKVESKIIDPGPVTVTGRLTYDFILD